MLSSVLAIFAKEYLDVFFERDASHALYPWSLESKLGDHVIMEITAASPSLLDSIDGLHDAAKVACENANLTIVAIKTHKFSPQVLRHVRTVFLVHAATHTTKYLTPAYVYMQLGNLFTYLYARDMDGFGAQANTLK